MCLSDRGHRRVIQQKLLEEEGEWMLQSCELCEYDDFLIVSRVFEQGFSASAVLLSGAR